jgi:hypothetical protein
MKVEGIADLMMVEGIRMNSPDDGTGHYNELT